MPYILQNEPLNDDQEKQFNDYFDKLKVSGHYEEMSEKRGLTIEDWPVTTKPRWELSNDAEELQMYLINLVDHFVHFCKYL